MDCKIRRCLTLRRHGTHRLHGGWPLRWAGGRRVAGPWPRGSVIAPAASLGGASSSPTAPSPSASDLVADAGVWAQAHLTDEGQLYYFNPVTIQSQVGVPDDAGNLGWLWDAQISGDAQISVHTRVCRPDSGH